MPFQTVKPTTPRGRQASEPFIRVTSQRIYLNKSLHYGLGKPRHLEIQVDTKAKQIRLVVHSKATASTRLVQHQKQNKVVTGGNVSSSGLFELLGFQESTNVEMVVEDNGKEATGSYKKRTASKSATKSA